MTHHILSPAAAGDLLSNIVSGKNTTNKDADASMVSQFTLGLRTLFSRLNPDDLVMSNELQALRLGNPKAFLIQLGTQ